MNNLVNLFKNAIKDCNKYDGTIGRKDFWLTVLAIFIADVVLSIVFGIFHTVPFLGSILSIALTAAVYYVMMALTAKRVRDAGHNANIAKSMWIGIGLEAIALIEVFVKIGFLTIIFSILQVIGGLTMFVFGIIILVFCCQATKGAAKAEAKEETKAEDKAE